MSWAVVGAIGSDPYLQTDGTNIYFKDDGSPDSDIKKYTHSSAITTKIGDATGGLLMLWKGRLYDFLVTGVVGPSTGGQITVDRWSGSGTVWSNVDTFTAENLKSEYGVPPAYVGIGPSSAIWYLLANDSYLIVVFNYETTVGFNNKLWARYTSDGVTWQSATFSDNREALHDFPPLGSDTNDLVNYPTKAGLAMEIEDPGGTPEIYEFVGGVMTERAGQIAAKEFIGMDQNFFWKNASGSHSNSERGTITTAWTALANTTVTPLRSNLRKPAGWSKSGADCLLHLWNNGEWAAGTVEWNAAATHPFRSILRLNDGTLFMQFASISGDWRVRDTPLTGSPGDPDHQYDLAGFFQGRDKVTFRSNIPVPSISPGGIHSVGKRVYLGAGEPSSPVVAYAENVGGGVYASWTDYSGTLPVDTIKAFSGTPWGDSEDLESSEDPAGFQGGPSGKCS